MFLSLSRYLLAKLEFATLLVPNTVTMNRSMCSTTMEGEALGQAGDHRLGICYAIHPLKIGDHIRDHLTFAHDCFAFFEQTLQIHGT